jgi:hypothetical protein
MKPISKRTALRFHDQDAGEPDVLRACATII